ncbi:MAG: Hpt domain-containing protein [Bacteroidales bacterium]|nr:Hpt domain-containing protein [Bacteroidales bacterium]
MVIDIASLKESFDLYDKETIIEIIDLFFEEYPERVKQLNKATETQDAELLRTSAHSLKGVISHFHAEKPRQLAKELEDKGAAQDFEAVEETKQALMEQIDQMLEELKEFKKEYQ